ncbi:MAG: putative toxin-antitoxin system toxin component, PIN family [Saprospiraceae bacterium]
MRILLDANIWVSGLISRSMRNRLDALIGRDDITILMTAELLAEIENTAARPKFSKYINPSEILAYLQIIQNRVDFILSETILHICRDPNDDYLLAICHDGEIEYFITGDKDLLLHDPFENTRILTLTDFEQIG